MDASRILAEMDKLAVDPQNLLDTACQLINIAGLYLDIGQRDKAGELLEETIEISISRKDNLFKVERLLETAELYAEIGDREKVERILETSSPFVELIEEVNRPGFLLRAADIYSTAGQPGKSRETLEKVLDIISRHPDSPSSPRDLLDAATNYFELGDKEAPGKF